MGRCSERCCRCPRRRQLWLLVRTPPTPSRSCCGCTDEFFNRNHCSKNDPVANAEVYEQVGQPWHAAAAANDAAMVAALARRGASARSWRRASARPPTSSWTVKKCYAKFAKIVNAVDGSTVSPLFAAASFGAARSLSILVELGGDVKGGRRLEPHRAALLDRPGLQPEGGRGFLLSAQLRSSSPARTSTRWTARSTRRCRTTTATPGRDGKTLQEFLEERLPVLATTYDLLYAGLGKNKTTTVP